MDEKTLALGIIAGFVAGTVMFILPVLLGKRWPKTLFWLTMGALVVCLFVVLAKGA